MKAFFTLMILCVISFSSFAQTPALDDFYHHHGLSDNIFKLNIGNTLIKMGSWFIEEPATKNLVRKSKRARIMLSDDSQPVTREDLDRLVREIKYDGYESLAFLREGKEKFEVYLREDKNYIRNLLVVYSGEDEFLMASLDCKFTHEEVQAAFNEEL